MIPVTRISADVDCSSNDGASAWIGAILVALIGPRSSIGSPVTFMIRPSVPGPTGILIGEPVSATLWPRTKPSVPVAVSSCPNLSEPFQHTVHGNASHCVFTQMLLCFVSQCYTSFPRCRKRTATSKMSLLPPFSVSRAFRIAGRVSPSNLTITKQPSASCFFDLGNLPAASELLGDRARSYENISPYRQRRHQ